MDTVIGWEAESALADRIWAYARDYLSADDFEHINADHHAGEWESVACDSLRRGMPITAELAAEIRAAWLDGRPAEDFEWIGRRMLAEAVEAATIVETMPEPDDPDLADRRIIRDLQGFVWDRLPSWEGRNGSLWALQRGDLAEALAILLDVVTDEDDDPRVLAARALQERLDQ